MILDLYILPLSLSVLAISQGQQRPVCNLIPCQESECEFGLDTNPQTGCKICRCKSSAQFQRTCAQINCQVPCPGGRYQRDSQGCETCTCQPVSPVPVCSLLDCGNVVCDFGREIVNGCPTCRCKPAETKGDVQQAQCPGGCRTGESCIVVNTLLSVNSDTGAVETIVIHACAPPTYVNLCDNSFCPGNQKCQVVEGKATCLRIKNS